MIERNLGGLTVGIPTRNAEWCLPNCFRALKAQTIQPDEYVICIGKSHDRTEELVTEFVKDINVPVIIIYDKEGIGTGYARKTIIETATKEYLYWIDSDVIIPKNTIETVYHLINKYNITTFSVSNDYKSRQITAIRAKEMYEKNEFPKNIDIENIKLKNRKPMNIHIFKRSIILEAGNYDPFFTRGQDEDLEIRLEFMKVKSQTCDEFFYLHAGVLDQYNKMFISQVFLKFLHKYTFRYIFFGGYHTEQVLAFIVRTMVLMSLLTSVIFTLFGLSPLMPILACSILLLILFTGVTRRYGFKPKLYVMQFFKCFGEYYTLYKLFTYKGLENYGYGWKQIQRLINTRKVDIEYV